MPVHLLREPSELYAARERDESHVVDLMESFMEKDSINRKGIKVAVLSKGLWNTWERSTEAQRKLDFPSKVLQMHRAAIQFDTMAETGGAKGQKKAKDARAAAIKSWCG